MKSELDKASLPAGREKYEKVRQEAEKWCIPAGVEILFKYFSIESMGQKELVLSYCKTHGDDALVTSSRAPISLHGKTDKDIIQIAKQCGFKRGDFDSFSEAVHRCIDLDSRGYELVHPSPTREIFFKHMKTSISNGYPFLMATENPDKTFHIWAVFAYDGDLIHAYDPYRGNVEIKTANDFRINYDCLLLKPKGAKT